MAEAVLNFYVVLEEHADVERHPKVRGAVRRLKRLKELDRVAPERRMVSEEDEADYVLEEPQQLLGGPKNVVKEPENAEPQSWWKRVFGG